MADYGLKVTIKGKDTSSTNPLDFTLDTTINMLKIYTQGKSTKSVTTGVVATQNISHNLGYKPIVFAFFKHPSGGKWFAMPCRTYDFFDSPPTWDLITNVKNTDNNTTQLRFYDGSPAMPSSPTNVDYKYFILADPRQDAWYQPASSDTDSDSAPNDYGIRLSRPGINVLTATPKNLVWSSSFPTFSIAKILKFTGAGSAAHGLSYPPAFACLAEDFFNSGEYIRGDVAPFINSGVRIVGVDSTNVYATSSAGNFPLYVLVFTNPLDE